MKIRSSTKIAIGFVVIAAGSIYGYKFYMRQAIMGEHFAPIKPGHVNLIGINPDAGFNILVVNDMAQLVKSSGQFHGNETDAAGATEGAVKKHIPIADMLAVLQGNQSKLGEFIMKVNDRDENDQWPPVRVVWKAEDIKKALDGDKALEAKLVKDLNVNLDGSPLPSLLKSSMENGIILDYPVPVRVNIAGKPTTEIGRFQEPFKPRLMMSVEQDLSDKDVNDDMIRGYYAQEAKALVDDPKKRDDIRKQLLNRLSPGNAAELAEYPDQILKSAFVIVNDSLIASASYRNYETGNGRTNDLTIELTDEGRRRLWQFSEGRIGTQIMFIKDGIAFAAPRISHELSQGELEITQMPDERLVKEAVAALNTHKKG